MAQAVEKWRFLDITHLTVADEERERRRERRSLALSGVVLVVVGLAAAPIILAVLGSADRDDDPKWMAMAGAVVGGLAGAGFGVLPALVAPRLTRSGRLHEQFDTSTGWRAICLTIVAVLAAIAVILLLFVAAQAIASQIH